MYPSEYAYRDDSVNRAERSSANCRNYPSGLQSGGFSDEYIHCDGSQLKLADSNLGREQYSSSDYYWWIAGSNEQLLFTFPTRVSLTTITLHYYSDSHQGLPRLKFYAVSDDFNVWDALSTGTPHVDVASVPPGGGTAGHRNVSINVNFNTRKVLMYKFRSTFQFAVSEVELCKYLSTVVVLIGLKINAHVGEVTTTTILAMNDIDTTSTQAESDSTTTTLQTISSKQTKAKIA